MENTTNEDNNDNLRNYSTPINPNLSKYNFYEGYLEKKARNFFVGWQKRYFRCLEGKIIIYTESKENKQIKGYIQIKNISNISSIDSKTFMIKTDDREYLLKAENEGIKNKWIEMLTYLMDTINQIITKYNNSSFDYNKSMDIPKKKKSKEEKIKTISKKNADLIKKYGYILNKEDPISKQILENKGISKLININDPKILQRIHYGFMYKKQKNREMFNKRWFFIFSQRPLFNDYYSIDDYDLEQKKQKEWIQFNVLYYYKNDLNEKNESEIDSSYDNKIEMVECHKIINFEKDGKYFMNLDAGDRAYNFYCESKSERDEWFEVLKNSRKTAKEYKLSVTKHPRNIDLLNSLFLKDIKEFNKKIEEEKNSITGNIKELSDFNIFEFTTKNLQLLIESTLDGCLCSTPKKLDLLKVYVEYMNKEYLDIFKLYWEKYYDKMTNEEILKMGYNLLNYYDNINKLNIDDENLLKNGKEFIKIYFKKIFQNILNTIENILKIERELKGNKNEEGVYYTSGPKDLFDILSKAFDLIKDFKHPIIFKELLKIFNISIFQYAIGVNCVISNRDIIIENEYLISVANNNLNVIQFLNSLIENIKNIGVLKENEIDEEIQFKKIINSINKLSFGSIVRFVYDHKDELNKNFEKINYFDINIEEIILKTGEIFGKYKSMMSFPVIKKTYNEILKLTLCYYITSLLLTSRKKKKNKEDIIIKVKNDKEKLFESYSGIVGENLTNTTLKILDDIITFLEADQSLIASPCLSIREYIGPAFSYAVSKKFVKLRSDLSKNEKIDCKKQCEDILNNFNGPKDEDSSYFILLLNKIKKNDKDKILKKSLKIKFGNIITESNEENENKESSSDSDIEEDKKISEKLNEKYNIENINDFLKDFEEENEQEEENELYEEKNINKNEEIYIDVEDEEREIIDDIDENVEIEYEGFLYKKNISGYKKYYFQIKNEGLYWFKDKESKLANNKISLKNINKIDYFDDKKFVIKINEKDDIKIFKFKCDSEDEKNKWIIAISRAMRKAKNENKIELKEKIEIKQRKKIINNLFNLPNLKIDGIYIEANVLGSLSREDFFKMTPEKFEKMKKENEKKMKKERKEKKKMEKLEKEKIKKEEKNREKEKSKEKINEREKENDKKRKKTLGNKIKNWFKSEHKKNNEEKETEEKKIDG